MEQPNEPTTSDIKQAMLALINPDQEQPEPTPEAPPEPAQEAQPEEAQEAPPEEAPEKKEEPPQEITKYRLTVKNDEGKDEQIEVDLSELQRGYMKDRDYRAKTQALARERETVQTKIKEATEPVVKQYTDQLKFFEQALWKTIAPEIEGVDLNQLAKDDPAKWAEKVQAINNVNGLLQAVKAEQDKLAQKQQEEYRASLRKHVSEAVETLQRDIPGWNNELYGSILASGMKYGYSQEELNAVADARAIKVLHDAMQYQRLRDAKPAVEKRVQEVPKVLKPGSTEKPDANREEHKKLMAQLKRSGRSEDAVAVLLNRINGS
jgi:hypothetical protein